MRKHTHAELVFLDAVQNNEEWDSDAWPDLMLAAANTYAKAVNAFSLAGLIVCADRNDAKAAILDQFVRELRQLRGKDSVFYRDVYDVAMVAYRAVTEMEAPSE